MKKNIFRAFLICLFAVLLSSCEFVDNIIDTVLPVKTIDCTVVFLDVNFQPYYDEYGNYYENDNSTITMQYIPLGKTEKLDRWAISYRNRKFLGWQKVDERKASDIRASDYRNYRNVYEYEDDGLRVVDYYDGASFSTDETSKKGYVVVLLAIWYGNPNETPNEEPETPIEPGTELSLNIPESIVLERNKIEWNNNYLWDHGYNIENFVNGKIPSGTYIKLNISCTTSQKIGNLYTDWNNSFMSNTSLREDYFSGEKIIYVDNTISSDRGNNRIRIQTLDGINKYKFHDNSYYGLVSDSVETITLSNLIIRMEVLGNSNDENNYEFETLTRKGNMQFGKDFSSDNWWLTHYVYFNNSYVPQYNDIYRFKFSAKANREVSYLSCGFILKNSYGGEWFSRYFSMWPDENKNVSTEAIFTIDSDYSDWNVNFIPVFRFDVSGGRHDLPYSHDDDFYLSDVELTMEKIKSVTTISFNNNGGEGSMSMQYIPQGETQKLNGCNFWNYNDYQFLGWNTDIKAADEGIVEYENEAEFTAERSDENIDIVLYAVWVRKVNQYFDYDLPSTNNPPMTLSMYEVYYDSEGNEIVDNKDDDEIYVLYGTPPEIILGRYIRVEILEDYDSYEWLLDGNRIANATGKSVTISTDGFDSEPNYQSKCHEITCIITDSNGERYSANRKFTVQ